MSSSATPIPDSSRVGRRCAWTNRPSANLVPVTVTVPNRFATHPRARTFWVLPEHEADLRRFMAYFARWGRTFLVAVLLLCVAMTIAGILRWVPGVGVGVVLIGILGVIFPFATPETVTYLGLRKAIALVRVACLTLAAAGLAIVLARA